MNKYMNNTLSVRIFYKEIIHIAKRIYKIVKLEIYELFIATIISVKNSPLYFA